jgi:DNA-binding MarR family transcriptional regulator
MAAKRDKVSDIIDVWRDRYPSMATEGIAIVNRLLVISQILQSACDATLASFGLSAVDFDILATLLRQRGTAINCSQLSNKTMLTNGAITKRIDSLVKRGYVAREEDLNDRRNVLICLTEVGKRVAESALKLRAQQCDSMLSSFTVLELRSIGACLAKLLSAIESPPKYFL